MPTCLNIQLCWKSFCYLLDTSKASDTNYLNTCSQQYLDKRNAISSSQKNTLSANNWRLFNMKGFLKNLSKAKSIYTLKCSERIPLIRLFRFFNKNVKDHLLYTSKSMNVATDSQNPKYLNLKKSVYGNLSDKQRVYQLEMKLGKLLSKNENIMDKKSNKHLVKPLYAYYNKKKNDHIYSTSNQLTGLKNLGVLGYILVDKAPGTVPLYRYVLKKENDEDNYYSTRYDPVGLGKIGWNLPKEDPIVGFIYPEFASDPCSRYRKVRAPAKPVLESRKNYYITCSFSCLDKMKALNGEAMCDSCGVRGKINTPFKDRSVVRVKLPKHIFPSCPYNVVDSAVHPMYKGQVESWVRAIYNECSNLCGSSQDNFSSCPYSRSCPNNNSDDSSLERNMCNVDETITYIKV